VIRSGHVLTSSDDDIGDTLTESFRAEGIRVITHAELRRVSVRPSTSSGQAGKKVVHALVDGEEREIAADEIFYALGRVPNVKDLGLEAAHVNFHSIKGISVDLALRTSNPDIYAVGDATGDYPLVHVAIYQGEVAARNASTGSVEEADYRIVTAHTIFTDPQVAIVGKSEKELLRANRAYVRGTYPFSEHGKAMCLNKTKGFVKILADPQTGEILGGSVIGPQASELIHEVIVAMNYCATVDQFMRIPHLHPTLAEIWTYPAEECAAQIGVRRPIDQMVEVATSGTAC
jgi:pyruvate/2-oxoglutarate dehydrogenase complex dihydrolipoamide dehydrogenase (E3) component